jgi:dihydropyrimidinase
MIVSEVNDSVLKEIDGLVDEGVTSLKLFMAFPDRHMLDDGAIFRTMLQAAESGAMVMMHAENGGSIDVLVRDCIAAGKTDPIFHARTRPPSLEAEAVNRTFALAELAGVPAYVAVSSREGLEEVKAARDRGVQAFAETCPHYLFLSEDALERARPEAVRFVCSPPLRPEDHQDDLWSGLAQGHVQVVATDHAPFDVRGQEDLGLDSFAQIPGGLPSVEERITLLFEGGVRGGRFGVNRFVELVATAPAKLFGLYPRKGTIAPGSDADITVFDPEGSRIISAEAHHMHLDYSCFEGMRAWGLPELVMQRGRVIVEGGEFVGREGGGHFLARGSPVL